MANNEIKDIYDAIKQYVVDDTDLTEDYMDKINRHFNAYLKNPTDKQEETFKQLRDALIILWLSELFKNLKKQITTQLKAGMATAKTALTNAQIKSVIKKAITSDKIKDLIQASLDKSITEITYVSNAIKVNSDRAISDIKSNIDKTKKAISTELMSEFQDYGIAFFVDSAGRRQSIGNYINKKSFDMASSAFRNSFIAELMRNGVEFVRVQRFPSPAIECNLCINYDEKILSINDGVEGFESIADAKMNGLWHFYCQHYVIPASGNFTKEEYTIVHTEENNKFRERNIRKGVKKTLFS
jgi:hypothetical protein